VNPPMIKGLFPPIPTPFDEGGELDTEALAENMAWWNGFDLSGFVVLGSNGEAAHLGEAEKLQLIETARACIPDDRTLITGTGLQSTLSTIRLTQAAASAGSDYALVLPPFYYRALMTDDVLDRHYRAIADSSPIPVILYNMPACTGIDLSVELVVRLSRHDNIRGLKDSSGNIAKIGSIYGELGDSFSILAGSGSFLLPALSVGAVGGVLALANIAPEECIQIHRFVASGDLRRATQLQVRLIPSNDAITRRWGVPGLKAAMEMLGLHGGSVRGPLRSLTDAARAQLRSTLLEARILRPAKEEVVR